MKQTVLKIGDKIKCKYFIYVRGSSFLGYMFDYKNYYYDAEGNWNKSVIPREEMEGNIKDDPSNADAWFEVIDVEEHPGGRAHNDIIEPYILYKVRKVGDNTHPIVTIATSGIDSRYFDLRLVDEQITFKSE